MNAQRSQPGREASATSLRPLDVDECMALMAAGYIGRLAFVQDGRPAILPLN